MSIALALLVSADPVTIGKFSLALEEYSLSPEVCPGLLASIRLLHRRKFDAVIVDLQLGIDCGRILDEVRVAPSNRTAVTFAIAGSDADSTALARSKTSFVFERPLSVHSIHATLKPAYGLILRERRRYFRCPISIPVSILRGSGMEVRGHTVNLSEGGMAVSTFIPLSTGEDVQVRFGLPDHKEEFLAGAEICWLKTGHLGVRFVSLSPDRKSDLQEWLAAKLEEMLPELVARQFRKEQDLFHEPPNCLVR